MAGLSRQCGARCAVGTACPPGLKGGDPAFATKAASPSHQPVSQRGTLTVCSASSNEGNVAQKSVWCHQTGTMGDPRVMGANCYGGQPGKPEWIPMGS